MPHGIAMVMHLLMIVLMPTIHHQLGQEEYQTHAYSLSCHTAAMANSLDVAHFMLRLHDLQLLGAVRNACD